MSIVLLLFSSCGSCTGQDGGDWTVVEDEDVLELHTTRVEGGWGYYITHGGDTTIWQPFIPALPGSQPFASEDDAACVGQLMVDKLRQGEDPGLTPPEVRQALGQ